LKSASKHGHLSIVQHLLTQVGNEVSSEHKGLALKNASANGHFAIVQELEYAIKNPLTYVKQTIEKNNGKPLLNQYLNSTDKKRSLIETQNNIDEEESRYGKIQKLDNKKNPNKEQSP